MPTARCSNFSRRTVISNTDVQDPFSQLDEGATSTRRRIRRRRDRAKCDVRRVRARSAVQATPRDDYFHTSPGHRGPNSRNYITQSRQTIVYSSVRHRSVSSHWTRRFTIYKQSRSLPSADQLTFRSTGFRAPVTILWLVYRRISRQL